MDNRRRRECAPRRPGENWEATATLYAEEGKERERDSPSSFLGRWCERESLSSYSYSLPLSPPCGRWNTREREEREKCVSLFLLVATGDPSKGERKRRPFGRGRRRDPNLRREERKAKLQKPKQRKKEKGGLGRERVLSPAAMQN